MKATIQTKNGLILIEGSTEEMTLLTNQILGLAESPKPKLLASESFSGSIKASHHARQNTWRPRTVARMKPVVDKWLAMPEPRPALSPFLESELNVKVGGDALALFRILASGKAPPVRKSPRHNHIISENAGIMRLIIGLLGDMQYHTTDSLVSALNLRNERPRNSIASALRLPVANGYVQMTLHNIGATLSKETAYQLTSLGLEWAKRNNLIPQQGPSP